jgi:DNA recombination protein RmuC
MEYVVPTLLGLALGYLGYLLGRRSQPQNQADLALQQELTGTKALLTAAETRRTQDTAALQSERDRALARAAAAETGLARAEEAKAAAQRSLEETKLSFAELEKRMREAFANAAQSQLTQSREQFIGMAEQKFAPFKSQLDELTRTNNELKGSLKTSNERSEKVAEDARKLAAAMTSTNKQGSWGELQLSRVAELTGMLKHVDFETQNSTAAEQGNLRPDMVISLPGGRKIVVDAKAPTKSYIEASQAPTEAERARLLQDFAAKLADHARKLGGKEYWNQYKPSPEFVVLFLPSEALFSTALQVDPLLIENAWGQKVVIATPTTLLSVLRTIAHSWDRVEVEQRAEKVIELAEKLHDGVRIASDHFADAGGSLNKAVKEYNQTLETLRSRVYNNAEKLITEGEKMKAERQLAEGATIDVQAHETLPEVKRPRKGAKELPGDEAAPTA